MREIKFRWIGILDGEKVARPHAILGIHWGASVVELEEDEGCTYGFEHGILEQFTGIKDNNSREIYEGDVVRTSISHESTRLPHMGEVVYDPEYCCFCTKNLGGNTPFLRHAINDREVIGNIHENPELLK